MLGLGASHLNLLLEGPYSDAAVKHRVIAMKGLNTFLSNAHNSLQNADAAFAATLILVFQSYLMEDGMLDFLTMIRGCKLLVCRNNWFPGANVRVNRLPCRYLRACGF